LNIRPIHNADMAHFAMDILYGILLVTGISISILGLLIYRYRRDQAPLILAAAGVTGALASLLFELDSSNAVDLDPWAPVSCLFAMVALILISLIRWRVER
jgi:hypothetical protein